VEAAANTNYKARFMAAMADDFNSAEAIGVLFELAREINRLKTDQEAEAVPLAALLRHLCSILGILQERPEDFLRSGSDDVDPQEIEALITERNQARADKNWALADEIRDKLKALKVVLEDKDGQTSWRIERD